MELPTQAGLDIKSLYDTFKYTTNSHKYFWFLSLLASVEENNTTCTFDSLACKMIDIARPLVVDRHLSLGYHDTLETAIKAFEKDSGINQQKLKANVLAHVPYRFLSPFAKNLTEDEMNGNRIVLANKLNAITHIPYQFTNFNGLNTTITFNPDWYSYFLAHRLLMCDWTWAKLLAHLKKRNPGGTMIPLFPTAQLVVNSTFQHSLLHQ